ncbi:inositol monophosphatase family protein [Mycolicibacterium helvum]|uniref:inositol monophosphatase family protein n=1 Tax=Mycolicibacterium helvum TaxID=1534349 RepID=UPI0013D0A019|nr:inositol monophosphatase family protein [Mycolicibacterium helvum]
MTAELLDVALAAARAGARVLRDGALGAPQITVKGERGNLVTDVDVAAERAVREVLAARRPGDEVTGEELPDSASAGSALRWSIDPLDGTTNFTRGIPYYATSVGVVDGDGCWLAGAVIAPELDKCYFGSLDGGAWLADSTGVRQLTGPAQDGEGARLLGMGYSYSAQIRAGQYAMTAELMAGYTDARALGSAALAVCAVAEGALDGYIETDLAEYDWAAGAVIAEAAGLRVVRPTASSPMLRIEPEPAGACEI